MNESEERKPLENADENGGNDLADPSPPGEEDAGEPPGEAAESQAADEEQGPTSDLSRAIQELVEERDRFKDRLLRTAAELENYKRRSRKELRDRAMQAEERVMLEFLPVADNLERALASTAETPQEKGLLDGVRMVFQGFLGIMGRFDIRPFEAVGAAFDPARHEAIQQIHSDQPQGAVCVEMRKGYLRGDRLVRPALVVVSKGPQESAAPAAEAGAQSSEGAGMEEPQAGDGGAVLEGVTGLPSMAEQPDEAGQQREPKME